MLTKSKSFLLIEDDPDDREFFVDTLRTIDNDAVCRMACNGEEALSTLVSNAFHPDCIFTDLNMPRMNGFEFIAIIRKNEEFRDVPIIVYSSTFSDYEQQEVRRLGASACYSKNTGTALPEMLKKYVSRKNKI